MSREIERKFLVGDLNLFVKALNGAEGIEIKQGYITRPEDLIVSRIRIYGDRGFLAVKGKTDGVSRDEFEYEIPLSDAEAIFQLAPYTLEKTRYEIKYGSHTFEVDVFSGRHKGLILVEVELDSEDQEVELPCWIGEEVTGDARYYNSRMAGTVARAIDSFVERNGEVLRNLASMLNSVK